VLILRPNVPLTFVNASVARDQIIRLIGAAESPPSLLILNISATADLDVATIDMLNELIADLGRRSIELRLAQVRGTVRDRMRRTGLMDAVGEERVFLSVSTAVEDVTPSASIRAEPDARPDGVPVRPDEVPARPDEVPARPDEVPARPDDDD
jgi:MFS superfamily sulfate permease-like transporter